MVMAIKRYYECPFCKKESESGMWDYRDVYCEQYMEEHLELRCPSCNRWVALVSEYIKEVFK
jgi:endogenous inhibitor of DNA gyrase (YacG/DUF329 family)